MRHEARRASDTERKLALSGAIILVLTAFYFALDKPQADTFTIGHIRDADTVCETKEGPCYRIWGVDAPERKHTCQEAQKAKAAGAVYWDAVLQGARPVIITGRYGSHGDRQIVSMVIDGSDTAKNLWDLGAVKQWAFTFDNRQIQDRPKWCE